MIFGLQIGLIIGGEQARQAVCDLDKSITGLPTNDFSVPLIAVLLSLADKEVVQAVVKSPSLIARLVRYTSNNMKARSVSVFLHLKAYQCVQFIQLFHLLVSWYTRPL